MSGTYRRFDFQQDPAADLAHAAQPTAEISKISNFSTGVPSSTDVHGSDVALPCLHREQRCLDDQMICTACDEVVGEAQIHRNTPANPAKVANFPVGDSSERHVAAPPPAHAAKAANPPAEEISKISNFSRNTLLDTHAAGTPPRRDAAPEEQEPIHYWSAILEEDFWLCATAAQAAALHVEGQVVYHPGEIWLLRDLKARDPATFAAKLRMIHDAKKAFGGTLDVRAQATGQRAAPPPPGTCCYSCDGTRRWRSVHGAVVCGTCHPPPDMSAVMEWEGEDVEAASHTGENTHGAVDAVTTAAPRRDTVSATQGTGCAAHPEVSP